MEETAKITRYEEAAAILPNRLRKAALAVSGEKKAAAEELRGLPPLFAYVGGLDPFRDENVNYWERLRRAGVFVEARVYPGCFHCFELKAPEAACAREAYDASYRALRRAFGLGA